MSASCSESAWRAELSFVIPHSDFESADDIRISTARQTWERVVDDPAQVGRFASLDPEGPEGLSFDGTLPRFMSPGEVVDASVAAALAGLTAAGLNPVGAGPVEVRLTSLPERPGISPGEPD